MEKARGRRLPPKPHVGSPESSSPISLMRSTQRIIIDHRASRHVVPRCRVRTSTRREGALLHASTTEQSREAIVPFNAAWFVIGAVLLVALLQELLLDGPGPRPHRRIFDRHDIFERVRSGPCPTLDQMQILT